MRSLSSSWRRGVLRSRSTPGVTGCPRRGAFARFSSERCELVRLCCCFCTSREKTWSIAVLVVCCYRIRVYRCASRCLPVTSIDPAMRLNYAVLSILCEVQHVWLRVQSLHVVAGGTAVSCCSSSLSFSRTQHKLVSLRGKWACSKTGKGFQFHLATSRDSLRYSFGFCSTPATKSVPDLVVGCRLQTDVQRVSNNNECQQPWALLQP